MYIGPVFVVLSSLFLLLSLTFTNLSLAVPPSPLPRGKLYRQTINKIKFLLTISLPVMLSFSVKECIAEGKNFWGRMRILWGMACPCGETLRGKTLEERR